jgi:PTH1 family peptidyl-tRNA hydrolase
MNEEASNVYLIAGLGNPGREYRFTRHNAGFLLLDRLAERLETAFARLESKALLAKGEFQGQRLLLAKPHTYMNLSGQAVDSLRRYYKVPLEHLLVAFDDVDLPLGTIRIRPGGGSSGQKGMASIIERLGTQDFARLRLGIGRPPGRMQAADYVLQDFSSAEMEIFNHTLERAVQAALVFVTEGLEPAMNQFNGTLERGEE